jgi:hypothetical protein
MRSIFSALILFFILLFSYSCSEPEVDGGPGTLTLHFDNVISDANLQLNTANTPYINSKSEPYKITNLRYYVSNINVKNEDGSVYQDGMKPDGSAGYYLVDESDAASQDVILENVPRGNYSEVTFTIGVDANQVIQGAQTGALDPIHGLFWSWNSGYIFMQVEGESPVSTETGHVFQYHVGGYKEVAGSTQANNIKTITLSFNGDVAPVEHGHEPEVHLIYDVNKFFNGPGSVVTFTTNSNRHSPKSCVDIAGNISGAFTVDHVHAN